MCRCPKFVNILLTVSLLLNIYKSDALLVSTISSGRGSATVALPSDTFVAAYNPAAMSWVGDRWDLGVVWQRDWGRTKISGNSDANNNGTFNSHHTENFFLPEFGINMNICECMLTLGFIIYNRSYSKVTYDTSIPIFGFKKLGLEYLQQTASPVCTIRFGTDHALGVSLDFVGQRLKIDGLESFANPINSDSPSHVTDEGYEYAIGLGITVGWMSKVSECVSIGFAWQPEIRMSHFRGYKGIVAHHGRLNLPQRFIGGFTIQFVDGVTGLFDVEHISWNDIPALDHPILPNFNKIPSFGDDNGAGLGWRDQNYFRVGLEWEITDFLTIRGGYSYSRTPIKRKETFLNILVPHIVEHYGTVGATWCINCYNEISFFLAYGLRNGVNGPNSIPVNLGGGSVKLTESKTMGGISWSRHF